MPSSERLGNHSIQTMRNENVRIEIVQIPRIEDPAAFVKGDSLISTGDADFQVICYLRFRKNTDTEGRGVIQKMLVVIGVNQTRFESHASRVSKSKIKTARDLLRVTIQIIKRGSSRNIGVMVKAEGGDCSIQIP